MSDLNLDNIVSFKAVDKDGNEQNVTVDEMVEMVSTRMVMALSETSTFATAAATGNDVYENELPTVTDAANVRVLQSSGDAAQMTMQSLASKLGELIGVNESWFRSRIPIFRGDVETLVVSGIYGVTPESTNNPINGYGILSVFSVGNESRVMYLLISVNGATFIRVKYDKSDSGWKKLSLAT